MEESGDSWTFWRTWCFIYSSAISIECITTFSFRSYCTILETFCATTHLLRKQMISDFLADVRIARHQRLRRNCETRILWGLTFADDTSSVAISWYYLYLLHIRHVWRCHQTFISPIEPHTITPQVSAKCIVRERFFHRQAWILNLNCQPSFYNQYKHDWTFSSAFLIFLPRWTLLVYNR